MYVAVLPIVEQSFDETSNGARMMTMSSNTNLTEGRMYEVISVYERRNAAPRTEVQCPGPFTHREACTVVSKFNPSKYVRILIREIV